MDTGTSYMLWSLVSGSGGSRIKILLSIHTSLGFGVSDLWLSRSSVRYANHRFLKAFTTALPGSSFHDTARCCRLLR